jgi:site-specific DNA recombinase
VKLEQAVVSTPHTSGLSPPSDLWLSQAFNSLDAQREAAESYVLSQREQGWAALPEHYDDGGFTGGNMDRPALKQLLTDIDASRIDCVIVYKVAWLSSP